MKRNLLILGASSDIGIALIKKEINNFSYIIAHYNYNNQSLNALKQEFGTKLILVKADLEKLDATQKMIEEIKKLEIVPTHIVHLPAGTFSYTKFTKINWDKYEADYNIAFRSLVLILQAFLPAMVKAKFGKIVVMLSSCTLNIPPKYLTSYVTSKYALLGLVKSLAQEYADKNIMINGISPTMIETKFLANIPNLVIEQNANESPRKTNLKVSDVVPLISFLLTDDQVITGQNIAITNGNK